MKKSKMSYIAIQYSLSTLLLIMFIVVLPVYAADLGNVKALTKARQAVKENPDSIRAHRTYQDLMIGDGWRDQMKVEYTKRLEEKGKSPENLYLLIRLGEDKEEKERDYQGLIETYPGFPWGYYGAAYLEWEMGNQDEALMLYEMIIELDPTMGDAYEWIAYIHETQGDKSKSNQVIEEGLKILPDDLGLLSYRAIYQRLLGNQDEAFIVINQILQKDPEHQEGLRQLGWLYTQQGKHEDAIVPRKKILSLWPENWETVIELSKNYFALYDQTKDLKMLWAAEEFVRQTLDSEGKNVDSYHNLVDFFSKRGWAVHQL
jgi:tetratricopeptide (TPR) repeat protein